MASKPAVTGRSIQAWPEDALRISSRITWLTDAALKWLPVWWQSSRRPSPSRSSWDCPQAHLHRPLALMAYAGTSRYSVDYYLEQKISCWWKVAEVRRPAERLSA
jgi:hypothetical protein